MYHCRHAAMLLGVFAVFMSATASAAPASKKDGMWVDAQGMTLYTYAKDVEGNSLCNDQCAKNWPPLAAGPDDQADGDWSVVTREDGSLQWAYYDSPLYTFKNDKKPGATTGDGKSNGEWQVARPEE